MMTNDLSPKRIAELRALASQLEDDTFVGADALREILDAYETLQDEHSQQMSNAAKGQSTERTGSIERFAEEYEVKINCHHSRLHKGCYGCFIGHLQRVLASIEKELRSAQYDLRIATDTADIDREKLQQ